MKEFLGWMALIFLMISYFSFMYMADYLYRKGIIRHRLVGVRPDRVFVEYVKVTKKEQHNIGPWFWVTLFSAIICLFAAMVRGLLIMLSQ